eukprot:TRINITY_DN5280_c0_g1_i1.p1 TRINITY_DN5280_c0_g1~~TRINITY_DN5280_c0_g1_i1.p1  ORF type:complete len:270 (-),score=38.59 TRINITY_DN5280_c0_g1_i1:243-1052(-)
MSGVVPLFHAKCTWASIRVTSSSSSSAGAERSTQVGSIQAVQMARHNHKTLMNSDDLYQYMLKTSCFPREPEVLQGLREETSRHPRSLMQTAPDEGQFLRLLLGLIGAKKTIEVGVYTGYSLLCTALALPADGKVIACDVTDEYFKIGLPYFEKAGVMDKIDLRVAPALDTLDKLLAEENNVGTFDFAFVDADKCNYVNYHKRLIELVRVGGVIAYDNTLWFGQVIRPEVQDEETVGIRKINEVLAADDRIEISMLALSDGVTLCRKLR